MTDSKQGSPSPYDQVARTVADGADELAQQVVDDWDGIIQREPWLALPQVIDQDHLPELIRELASCSIGNEFGREPCQQLIQSAAKHGHDRYLLGVDESVLFREYHLLRHGVWKHLRERFSRNEQSALLRVITRFDAGISLASRASLHGYHKATHEKEGRWPDVLGTLLDEWCAGRSADRGDSG